MADALATLEFENLWSFVEAWTGQMKNQAWTAQTDLRPAAGSEITLPIKLPGTGELIQLRCQVMAALPNGLGLAIVDAEGLKRVGRHATLIATLMQEMLESRKFLLAPPDGTVPAEAESINFAAIASATATAPSAAPAASGDPVAPPAPTGGPIAPPPPASASSGPIAPPPLAATSSDAIAPPPPASASSGPIAPPAPAGGPIAPPPPAAGVNVGPSPGLASSGGFDPFGAEPTATTQRFTVERSGLIGGPLLGEILVDIAHEGGSGKLDVEVGRVRHSYPFAQGMTTGSFPRLVELCGSTSGRFSWAPSGGGSGGIDPRAGVFAWELERLRSLGRGALDVELGPHNQRYVIFDEEAVRKAQVNALLPLISAGGGRTQTIAEHLAAGTGGADQGAIMMLAGARAGLVGLAAGPMDDRSTGVALARLDRWSGLMRRNGIPAGLPLFSHPNDIELYQAMMVWMFGDASLWPSDEDVARLREQLHQQIVAMMQSMATPQGRLGARARVEPRVVELDAAIFAAQVRRSGHPSNQPWVPLLEAGAAPHDARGWPGVES